MHTSWQLNLEVFVVKVIIEPWKEGMNKSLWMILQTCASKCLLSINGKDLNGIWWICCFYGEILTNFPHILCVSCMPNRICASKGLNRFKGYGVEMRWNSLFQKGK